ncbi:MAG: hypothetical protein KatS3mg097_317 [Candidatus Parcubacteria bacterium]|nr:MAG: hypothetical protein KatS3mg097_317 [Candidatus Parcubacteria bacterium]
MILLTPKQIFSLVVGFIFLINFVLATSHDGCAGLNGFDFLQCRISVILGRIIQFLFIISLVLASVFLIYLGLKYILGQASLGGKSSDVSLSKVIFYVILGVAVVLMSIFLPVIIKNFIESITS